MKGFPPHCFLIGAQKAGTTYLAGLLDQHPGIHVSTPKETDFFTGRVYPRGMGWYRQCFPEYIDGEILLDASTSYSAAPRPSDTKEQIAKSSFSDVAKRIYDNAPDARFIYILRNPIKRTYSAYWHQVRTGEESRSFQQVLTGPADLRDYYLLSSEYHVQLEHYLKYFDLKQIKVLVFEQFIKAPEESLRSCFRFLNLDDQVEIKLEIGKHESFRYKGIFNKLNTLLAPWGGLRPLFGTIKKGLPEQIVNQGKKVVSQSIPPMPPDDFEILAEYFIPRIEQLEKLLGLSLLPLWIPKGQLSANNSYQYRGE